MLPKTITKPACIIMNIDNASKPGKHWLAYWFDSKGCGEFFDSFGWPPGKFFRKYLESHSDRNFYNPILIQNPLSTVCGQYCLYYLIKRARGIPMDLIMAYFDANDRTGNDEALSDWFNDYFNTDFKLVISRFPNKSNCQFQCIAIIDIW